MKSAVIKAALRTDERLAGVSALACLMHVYAHTACDDYGRLKGNPSWWAMNVVPGRAKVAECATALKELIGCGVVAEYTVGGVEYLMLGDWFETQTFQNNFILRAVYPNHHTGEVEPPAYWNAVRDAQGMRKRGERLNLKSHDVKLRNHDSDEINLETDDLNLGQPGVKLIQVVVVEEEVYKETNTNPVSTTTTDINLKSDEINLTLEPLIPYWEGHADPMVEFMGKIIASVPKYANASRPATLTRVEEIIERIRTEAPDDQAIKDMLTDWCDFNQADTSGKFGKQDPIASIRQQIGFRRPRWAVMRKRMDESNQTGLRGVQVARTSNHTRGESAVDELARITGQKVNSGS
jgi:hypothetical protein